MTPGGSPADRRRIPSEAARQAAVAPEVAIVVLNWNGGADTVECLRSLENLQYPAVQTIVVDNGSTDDSVAMIRQQFPDIDLLETGRNLGYAGGNNAGIRRAMGMGAQYVLLLNNDTIVDAHLIDAFVEAALQHPEAAMLGAKIFLFDQPDTLWWAGSRWEDARHGFLHVGNGQRDTHDEYSQVVETDYAVGCALFVSAQAIEQIGLMEEQYFLTYEETDWAYRARAHGFKALFVPQAKVWHKVSVSFGGAESPLFKYFMTRNRLLFASRHLSREQRRALYRSVYWSLRQQLGAQPGPGMKKLLHAWQNPLIRAEIYALRDFMLRRFGDCPDQVRRLPRITQTRHAIS